MNKLWLESSTLASEDGQTFFFSVTAKERDSTHEESIAFYLYKEQLESMKRALETIVALNEKDDDE